MTYDSDAERVILFGGWNGSSFMNDTWEYNFTNNKWCKLSTSDSGGSLTRLADAKLAYDSVNQVFVLFGGQYLSSSYNETWLFYYGNKTWVKKNPDFVGGTLSPRDMHTICYDSNAERVVLFGGEEGVNTELNETWVYNVSVNTWYKVSFSVVGGWLVPREAARIVYDSSARKVVLFGGYEDDRGNGDLNETWVLNTNDYTATITWTTDEPADSVVNYGTTITLGNTTSDSSFVTNHQIVLTDLIPDTTYYYEIQSTDQYGHTTIDNNNGNYYTFTTEQDTTPPVISNVQATGISHNSATITWDTDEDSHSRVNYGTTTALGYIKSNSEMVTSHSITLIDLLPETTYYYEVQSTDIEGNTAIDNNSGSYYTFTTEQTPSNVMHVYSIDMWYEPVKNRNSIYTKVKIVDASDNAVEGVTVYLETTLPNGDTISADDVTDSTGFVTFIYGPTPKTGTYTSSVINVAKDGWTYNPDENVETSESIYVS